MNLDTKALIGFFKEIEVSRDRQKAETELQRDVFKRARAKHFDAKAMRIVLQRRAMETTARDTQDYNVHAYELALGGKKDAMEALEQGASTREAAKIGGISNGAAAALAKGAQKSSFVSAPHDPETGEINGEDVRDQRPNDVIGCGASSDTDESTGRGSGSGTGGQEERPCVPADEPAGAHGQSAKPAESQGASSVAIPPLTDDLAIPAHLRRVRA